MAVNRLGSLTQKRTRIAAKACPRCSMGSVDDLKGGQFALQTLMAQQRLKSLAKARRVKARNAKRRSQT